MQMVVEQSCKQVVGRFNGMYISREVKVDLLHGQYLGVTAAGSASLYSKAGPKEGSLRHSMAFLPSFTRAWVSQL